MVFININDKYIYIGEYINVGNSIYAITLFSQNGFKDKQLLPNNKKMLYSSFENNTINYTAKILIET